MEMPNITMSDFDKICRTCLEMKQEMVSIYTRDIWNMLQTFTTIKVPQNEHLPNQICSDCVCKTFESFKFKKQCENSEEYLLEILNESDSKKWFEDNENIKCERDVIFENDKINTKIEFVDNDDVKQLEHFSNEDSTSHRLEKITEEENNDYDEDDYCNINSEQVDDNDSIDTTTDDFKVATDPETRKNKLSLRKLRINWVMSLGSDKCDTTSLQCKICNKTLVNISSLARHMETHDKNRKFSIVCSICNKGFYEKGNYLRHMLRHKREAKYKCDKCSKSFYELNILATHLQKCHDVKPIPCSKCNKKFIIQDQLNVHMKKHTNEFDHVCPRCGKGYFLIRRLKEHMLTHERTYLCEICNKTYKNHSSLNKHNFRYHKTVQERQVCQICGKTVLHMKAHLLIHNGARMFECVECKKSFIHRSDLVAHCKRKHRSSDEPPLLPYLCNICGKRKLSNAALEQHIIHAHTTEKTQKCDLCDKRFKTDNALKSHIRYSHKDVRNYKCTTCGKSFYTNAILRNHMRTHTGERPFICHICSRAFGKNSTLKTHMKIHSTAEYDN